MLPPAYPLHSTRRLRVSDGRRSQSRLAAGYQVSDGAAWAGAGCFAELHRVEELHGKAVALVDELERRQTELIEDLRQKNATSASALVAALDAGTEAILSADDAAIVEVEQAKTRLSISRQAVQQLDARLESAKRTVAAAEKAVRRAALLVGSAWATGEAEQIELLAAALYQRRTSLWSATAALTHLGREVGAIPALTPAVHRAVGEARDAGVDSAWSARLQRLHADPEAELS